MFRLPRSCRTRFALAFAALSLAGCRDYPLAFGSVPASAVTNVDAFAAAVQSRFTQVTRTPKFANARMRLGRYALAPSKLAFDTSLWTSLVTTRTGAERELELHAGRQGPNFHFTARAAVAAPIALGEQRHLIRLRQLSEDDWDWNTEVDQAVGPLPVARVNDIARALFRSAERPEAAIRTDYRTAFARTTTALGRLLSLDSLATVPQSDGSTLVTMLIRVEAKGIRATHPAFARYIAQYVEPARYRYRLSDAQGNDWFDAAAHQRLLTVRFRSRGGQLQPLRGPSRQMPDTLVLHADALAKLGIFTVGVTALDGEFVHVTTPRERSWAMRFTKDPHWHLPLIAERLLRSPLERPFVGRGVVFRFGLRTGAEGQTLLSRSIDVSVRESAIMRFLGNLGFTAMSDYAGRVEEEENRFIAEVFGAMRADFAALR